MKLNKVANGFASSPDEFLNKHGGSPSGTGEEFVLSLDIHLSTCHEA